MSRFVGIVAAIWLLTQIVPEGAPVLAWVIAAFGCAIIGMGITLSLQGLWWALERVWFR